MSIESDISNIFTCQIHSEDKNFVFVLSYFKKAITVRPKKSNLWVARYCLNHKLAGLWGNGLWDWTLQLPDEIAFGVRGPAMAHLFHQLSEGI